ncbi:MAG TPA: branched-chain amino acid ABC transporter permease [Thermodesulfobacteriota bacterium]|nr:branched-chain amino acid ABC transporter permease [Thermodesulfobacteriota bacterium]
MSSDRRNFLLALGVAILLALVPLLTRRNDLINLMVLIFLYVCLAQSWNILAGYAGQVSLGHAAFFGLGAITTRFLWAWGCPFFLAFLSGGVVAVVFALMIGHPALRLKGIYFAIGTLGLGQILKITVGNVLPTVASLPEDYIATYNLIPRYYLFLILAVIIVAMVYWISRSKLGLGMVAVREDEEAAKASGVNTFRQKIIALSISTFFAGLAGGAFAFYQVSYYYELPFSPTWTFDALLITFVGGVGTIVGPIVGAFFYAIFKELFARTFPELHVFIFGLLFVLVVLLLPGGLVEMVSRIRRLITAKRHEASLS